MELLKLEPLEKEIHVPASVNVLEVRAAASVTIQFSGQSQGGIGWEEGASPLQDLKMIPGFTAVFIG